MLFSNDGHYDIVMLFSNDGHYDIVMLFSNDGHYDINSKSQTITSLYAAQCCTLHCSSVRRHVAQICTLNAGDFVL
jgi:hypothetical protein